MEREPGIWEFEMEAQPGQDIRRDINRIARENDWNILLLKTMEMTLEDIFLKITMGEQVEMNKKGGAQ
jgi:ABC-2 type transport system ATP-binding protein